MFGYVGVKMHVSSLSKSIWTLFFAAVLESWIAAYDFEWHNADLLCLVVTLLIHRPISRLLLWDLCDP